MKIAFHISCYFNEERLKYLNEVISGINTIEADISIFIYSNKDLKKNIESRGTNIKVFRYLYNLNILKPLYRKYGYYPFKHWSRRLGFTFLIHPYFLSWENRKIIKDVVNEFDIQMYLEDDILFTHTNFKYWCENKDRCLKSGYNLGFLRSEVDDKTGKVFYHYGMSSEIKRVIYIDGVPFLIKDEEPYAAFWIMDKSELKAFIKSPEWEFKNDNYGEREISAVGWHGKHMSRYKGTVIRIQQEGDDLFSVVESSLVHHLPNNYIGHDIFCKVAHPLKFKADVYIRNNSD